MEGFKQQKKIACFKEGGQVGYKSRKEHSESKEMAEDVKQDKKIVKKAFSIHDKQQHEEKTDLSKLKKGGRAKKETGTVKKYCGGKSVKKMADGSLTEKIMGTAAQNEAAKKNLSQVAKQPGLVGALERGAQKAANFLKGQGAITDAERDIANTANAPSAAGKKRGGKC
jgi:hypothetical protein